MAGGIPDLVQRPISPSPTAKLRRAVGFDASDMHLRFILTERSLGELVIMSENATVARRIRSIGFAALLINATRVPMPRTGFRQSYGELQARLYQQQQQFVKTERLFQLIHQAFRNLAQHGKDIRLLVYDDTDEAGHFEKGLHFGAQYGPWGTDPGTP